MEHIQSSSFRQKLKVAAKWALRVTLWLAIMAVGVLLVLLIGAAGNTSDFAEQFDLLLLLNAVLALGLFVWVLSLAIGLVRRVRNKKFGAKLTSKFVFFFATIAIVPGLVVYFLSTQFISKSVESWFNVKVDSALASGLTLGQASLDSLTTDALMRAKILANSLDNVPDDALADILNRFRDDNQTTDILIFSANGTRVLTFASSSFGTLLPQLPPSAILNQLRVSRQYAKPEEVYLENSAKGKSYYQIRVIVPVYISTGALEASIITHNEAQWLQLTRTVPDTIGKNLKEVQIGLRNYEELALSRNGLKQLFSITLTMALLLTVFVSLGIALWIARRLVEPLLTLAEGTQAVAAGDYRQLPQPKQSDEVAQLTRSFNIMTGQLDEARKQVQNQRLKLEQSNFYLESVLAGLTAGVIVLDEHFYVTLFNKGAEAILYDSLADVVGKPLHSKASLVEFSKVVRNAFSSHQAVESERLYWQEQIELHLPSEGNNDRQLTLLLRGTHLRFAEHDIDYLLVFDDISEVMSANRAVAWGEVARRLAHEIKNPLTPIQLSAERLQFKLSSKLGEQDAQFLERSTNTIVNQVFSLKTMVDDFREYARTPPAQLQHVDINALITDIAILYGWTPEGNEETLLYRQLTLALDPKIPLAEADPTQLRQVFNNLLSNARDAMENLVLTGDEPGIAIKTKCIPLEQVQGEVQQAVRITITDRGSGFPESIYKKVFEPYVTTKKHGTGLGLAIVRKIVEEHDGKIDISNRPEGGAKISILLTRIVKK